MGSTLLGITKIILQRIGEKPQSSIAGITEGVVFDVLNAIDETAIDVCQRNDWDFLQTAAYANATYTTSLNLTTGTRTLSVPSTLNENTITRIGLAKKKYVVSPSYNVADSTITDNLTWIDPKTFLKDFPYEGWTSNAQPTAWTLFERNLYLNPAPDANGSDGYSIKLFCNKRPARYSRLDSTTIDTWIPEYLEHILIAGTCWRVLLNKNFNLANFWFSQYENSLAVAIDNYNKKIAIHEMELK